MPPAQAAPPAAPPLIVEVKLEKAETCIGEENLVTVRAHTAEGRDDAYLRYRVDSLPGPAVPLRVYPSGFDSQPVPRFVTVTGRHGASTQAELPSWRINDCRKSPDLFLGYHRAENSPREAELRFVADVLYPVSIDEAQSPPPLRIDRYRWSFGDGQTAETSEPTVVHDYSDRPQTTLASYFLVTCEAVDVDGNTVRGRVSVELENPVFDAFMHRGTVALKVDYRPREATVSGGVLEQRVHLSHHWPEPVHLERARVRVHLKSGLAVDDRAAKEVPLAALLGQTSLPPSGVEARIAWDTREEPEVLAREYLLEGRTLEGWRVAGGFTVTVPGTSRQFLAKLNNPAWRARYLRARELSPDADLSEDDLRRLEKQGLFEDLPPPEPVSPPPPPPAEPPGTAAAVEPPPEPPPGSTMGTPRSVSAPFP